MNEVQSILADSVEKFFGSVVTPALLDDVENGVSPARLWQEMEEQGFASALIPEELGGYGGHWHDAYFISRAVGRFCVPLPIAETLIARWLLVRSGLPVNSEPLTIAAPAADVVIQKDGSKHLLSGTIPRAPWGRAADAVVFTLRHEGNHSVVKVPVSGAQIKTGANLAGEWRDDLAFESHPIQLAPWSKKVFAAEVDALGAMLRSAQIAGGLSTLTDLSVAYANERKQFGRPIGKYQAIQQNLAVLASEAAAAEVAAEMAFRGADRHDPLYLAAAAKIRCAEAAAVAGAIAHQVHGAIGFTREYPLHRTTRRLMAWREEFGCDRAWAMRLGRHVLKSNASGFWAELTAQI